LPLPVPLLLFSPSLPSLPFPSIPFHSIPFPSPSCLPSTSRDNRIKSKHSLFGHRCLLQINHQFNLIRFYLQFQICFSFSKFIIVILLQYHISSIGFENSCQIKNQFLAREQ
jgi:hypothetical protein